MYGISTNNNSCKETLASIRDKNGHVLWWNVIHQWPAFFHSSRSSSLLYLTVSSSLPTLQSRSAPKFLWLSIPTWNAAVRMESPGETASESRNSEQLCFINHENYCVGHAGGRLFVKSSLTGSSFLLLSEPAYLDGNSHLIS
jgi:hypothetical protein